MDKYEKNEKINIIDIIEKILNLLYPPVCAFCGKLDEEFLCEECKKKIEQLQRVTIEKQKNKLEYKDRITKNEKINKNYDEHIYMFKYDEYIREKILNYKFNEKSYYYKTFVKILLNNKKICEKIKSYDIIISVPIHNKRKKQRGYNQTELIAREIAKKLQIEYKNILIKTENTIPQSKLDKKQRIQNAKNKYKINQKILNKEEKKYINKKILIFDDIFTTGSTVNECAKKLRLLNFKKIGVLTIAKD